MLSRWRGERGEILIRDEVEKWAADRRQISIVRSDVQHYFQDHGSGADATYVAVLVVFVGVSKPQTQG